jgi:hypothetical protein
MGKYVNAWTTHSKHLMFNSSTKMKTFLWLEEKTQIKKTVALDQALSNKHYAPVRCKVLKTADDTNSECANNLMSSFAKGENCTQLHFSSYLQKNSSGSGPSKWYKDIASQLGQAKIIKSLINPTSYFERERRNLLINVRIPTHKSKEKTLNYKRQVTETRCEYGSKGETKNY